jgi:UDP-glucose 4-epimerase|tara:strand:- start:304 stop:1236 length:933 start_codon:yes stop_codon:yes gene_type:complete
MRYLVTGGAGFIGSNLVTRLLNDGHEVVVIDNESSDAHKQFYWDDRAENYKYDITDYEKIFPLFKGVDVVFHIAAQARIQICINDPTTAVKTNMLGTCCVLQAAKENGVRRLVYSSTSSAYGLANDPPLVETMPNDCLNPYSVSKVSGEELCKMYSDLYDFETIIFRYFNVYGERQPIKGQYAQVIGVFQRQFATGEPITVVGDGLQTRDYTHVSDVIEANLAAANTDNKNAIGEIFNIGYGENHSVMDLVKMIGGWDSPEEGKDFVYIPERPGEARHTLSDTTKSYQMLDWTAKIKLKNWITLCKQPSV